MAPMKSQIVQIQGAGGVEVLKISERVVASPGPGQLLIEVAAAGLNRADILQRRGFYPAPDGAPADVPGLEYAGKVVAVGDGVGGFGIGDRVMGIVGGGAMARHLIVHEREAIPIPASLSFEEAAAVPEVFMTAWDALFLQASAPPGAATLIHAVGSGVGTAALQLCVATGIRAVGTSRSAWKLDRCRELGLTHGVETGSGSFAEGVREVFPAGADVILDTVGAVYAAENLRALATKGRWVMIGLLGGARAELNLGALLALRAQLIGTVLRTRPLEEKALLARRFAAEVVPLFEEGRLAPVIDTILPMEDIAEAHHRLESNETFGKIVLSW